MRWNAVVFFFVVVFGLQTNIAPAQEPTLDIVPNTHSNDAFGDKEWFEFRIHYGFFNASVATLEVRKDSLNGKPVFHAKGYGRTTGLARWFFKVEDHYESFFDPDTGVPYKTIRDINEGGYTKDLEIDFNHETQMALVFDKKKNTRKEFAFNDKAQDFISAFYYLRNFVPTADIQPQQSFSINMFFDNDNYVFKLKYLGKEFLNTAFGRVRCLKFRPLVQAGRVFKEQESVTLWVSDDRNKIPLRLQADLAVGSIKADLEKFKNLKHPFNIEVQ